MFRDRQELCRGNAESTEIQTSYGKLCIRQTYQRPFTRLVSAQRKAENRSAREDGGCGEGIAPESLEVREVGGGEVEGGVVVAKVEVNDTRLRGEEPLNGGIQRPA